MGKSVGKPRRMGEGSAQVLFTGLPAEIGQRMIACLRKDLPDRPDEAPAIREIPAYQGRSVILMIEARKTRVTEIASGFGQLGVPAERLAKTAAGRLKGYFASGAVAGPYLADQLVLPFALAGGGSFTTVEPSGSLVPGSRSNRMRWAAIWCGLGEPQTGLVSSRPVPPRNPVSRNFQSDIRS